MFSSFVVQELNTTESNDETKAEDIAKKTRAVKVTSKMYYVSIGPIVPSRVFEAQPNPPHPGVWRTTPTESISCRLEL
jgi:hypothetical protein